jgi:hypothetical protein
MLAVTSRVGGDTEVSPLRAPDPTEFEPYAVDL